MLSAREIALLKTRSIEEIKKIDISKLDPKDNQNFIAYALEHYKWKSLRYYLQGMNADKVIAQLLTQKNTYITKFIHYLLIETNPDARAHASALLMKCVISDQIDSNIRTFSITDSKLEQLTSGKKMSAAHYVIATKNYLALNWLLQRGYANKYSQELLTKLLDCNDSLTRTPLEYALALGDTEACKIILDFLAVNNDYATAIMQNDQEYLQKLLTDFKPETASPTQLEQLRTAWVCSMIVGKSWNVDHILLDAGVPIFPTSRYYRRSILHRILSTSMNAETQTTLVKKCLKIVTQSDLQERFNGQNLLELACKIIPQNDEIINLLDQAGARFPEPPNSQPKVKTYTRSALIICMEKDNESHFPKLLSEAKLTQEQIIQAAEYSIEINGKTAFLKILLNQKGNVLKSRTPNTLADFAINKLNYTVLPLLEAAGIIPAKKPATLKEEKISTDNKEIIATYVRTENMTQLNAILEANPNLLYELSPEGLSLIELAIIYEKFNALNLLANFKFSSLLNNQLATTITTNEESTNQDPHQLSTFLKLYTDTAAVDESLIILDQDKLNKLLKTYSAEEYSNLRTLLNSAVQYRAKQTNTLALERITRSIAKGLLQPTTLSKLALIPYFKEKVIDYLEELSEQQNKDKIIDLIILDAKNINFKSFFGISRGVRATNSKRGTLLRYETVYFNTISIIRDRISQQPLKEQLTTEPGLESSEEQPLEGVPNYSTIPSAPQPEGENPLNMPSIPTTIYTGPLPKTKTIDSYPFISNNDCSGIPCVQDDNPGYVGIYPQVFNDAKQSGIISSQPEDSLTKEINTPFLLEVTKTPVTPELNNSTIPIDSTITKEKNSHEEYIWVSEMFCSENTNTQAQSIESSNTMTPPLSDISKLVSPVISKPTVETSSVDLVKKPSELNPSSALTSGTRFFKKPTPRKVNQSKEIQVEICLN